MGRPESLGSGIIGFAAEAVIARGARVGVSRNQRLPNFARRPEALETKTMNSASATSASA